MPGIGGRAADERSVLKSGSVIYKRSTVAYLRIHMAAADHKGELEFRRGCTSGVVEFIDRCL